MGYILLSNQYIDGIKNNNWQIFKAKFDGEKIIFESNAICDNSIIVNSSYNLFEYDYELNIKLPYRKLEFYYLLPCQNNILHEIDNYYTDRNNSFYYSDNENIIRIIASIIGREVCGNCMQIMHGKED